MGKSIWIILPTTYPRIIPINRKLKPPYLWFLMISQNPWNCSSPLLLPLPFLLLSFFSFFFLFRCFTRVNVQSTQTFQPLNSRFQNQLNIIYRLFLTLIPPFNKINSNNGKILFKSHRLNKSQIIISSFILNGKTRKIQKSNIIPIISLTV